MSAAVAAPATSTDALEPPQTLETPPTPDILSPESVERHRKCAERIGIDLLATSPHTPRTGDPRTDFMSDHSRFLAQHGKQFKIRRLGGAELDLFALYRAVMERGGLQAVITTRAFKMVAKALNLPRTCTSAAFILRVEYEKLLYAYEQKHVWGRSIDDVAPLIPADKTRRVTIRDVRHQPAPPAAVHPLQKTRPRRQAALAASSAVAAAVSDDPYSYPVVPRRPGRLTGFDEEAVDEAAVEDEIINDSAPHALYVPGQPGERERVVSALWSPIHDDVAWALGTLNALSFDSRNVFVAHEFSGILEALHEVLNRHLEDLLRQRAFGVAAGVEFTDEKAPRVVDMPAMDVRISGGRDTASGVGVTQSYAYENGLRSSSLQQYPHLFNLSDPIAIDREQCAVVAGNVLRNMSFFDRNAILLANSQPILNISAVVIDTIIVPANLRDALMDMWINVSPYLNASRGAPGHVVLITCIKLLDAFREGSDLQTFTNIGEVLARLAASPERNEGAIVETFDETLPRLVDMLGGRNRRYVNAGLAALCNFSAFDWSARDRIARVPRALERLVCMLADREFAPRAALTLSNLAEAPNNRSVMLAYEERLVGLAFSPTPAADTVASILFELSHD